MNLQEIREQVQFRLNKDQAGNTLSPAEYNNLLQLVSLEYFKSQLGLDKVSPVRERVKGFQVTQLLTENTRHLLVNRGLGNVPITVNTAGVYELPEDYFTYTEMNFLWVKDGKDPDRNVTKEIETLSDNDWISRIGSMLKKPSFENPVGRFISEDRGQIRPLGISRLNLSYIRYPIAPVYAFTLGDDDSEIYDPGNSIELDWPEITHPDIANMLVSYASDNIRDTFMKQSAETRKQKGE